MHSYGVYLIGLVISFSNKSNIINVLLLPSNLNEVTAETQFCQ